MRSSDSAFVRLYGDGEDGGVIAGGDVHPADREVSGGGVPVPPGEQVLSIEELARQFNVSTKTISRWRDHGLVAQRYVVGGRRRVGFLASTVERFMHDNPLRIERGSRFSQLSDEEHDKIISWARRLALAGACP